MTKNAWSDGDAVTATQLNRMEDQLVITCTSGTRPTGVEGQRIFETDTNREFVYNGSSWRAMYSEWTTFTPSWTNLSVGNGTVTADYCYLPTGVRVRVQLTFGSTTSISGNVELTLPNSITSRTGPSSLGMAQYVDIGGSGDESGTIRVDASSTTAKLFTSNMTEVNSTTPFTWGTSDVMILDITFGL